MIVIDIHAVMEWDDADEVCDFTMPLIVKGVQRMDAFVQAITKMQAHCTAAMMLRMAKGLRMSISTRDSGGECFFPGARVEGKSLCLPITWKVQQKETVNGQAK